MIILAAIYNTIYIISNTFTVIHVFGSVIVRPSVHSLASLTALTTRVDVDTPSPQRLVSFQVWHRCLNKKIIRVRTWLFSGVSFFGRVSFFGFSLFFCTRCLDNTKVRCVTWLFFMVYH